MQEVGSRKGIKNHTRNPVSTANSFAFSEGLPQKNPPQRSGSACSETQEVALAVLAAHANEYQNTAHSKGSVSTQDRLTGR